MGAQRVISAKQHARNKAGVSRKVDDRMSGWSGVLEGMASCSRTAPQGACTARTRLWSAIAMQEGAPLTWLAQVR